VFDCFHRCRRVKRIFRHLTTKSSSTAWWWIQSCIPQFSVALVFCDESVVFGVEYVECGLGWEASSSKCVSAPLFSDDYFKVERLRFSRGFRVAIPAVYCDFRMGQSLRRHVVTTKNIISGFGYTLCCVVLCCVVFVWIRIIWNTLYG
jgi:hypothetical protein